MKITGLDIAIIVALLLLVASLLIRLVWLLNTNWTEVIASMTATDWLMTAAILPLLVWLRLKK